MKLQVKAPVDKVKELILKEYPHYYSCSVRLKRSLIHDFVKPIDQQVMYQYMENTKDGGKDE